METTALGGAPLPVLGVAASTRLNDNWASKRWPAIFWPDIDNVDGSLVAADVSLQYHPWRHVGLTLGYAFFDRLISIWTRKNGTVRRVTISRA